jgi:hypothetical protein
MHGRLNSLNSPGVTVTFVGPAANSNQRGRPFSELNWGEKLTRWMLGFMIWLFIWGMLYSLVLLKMAAHHH